MELRVPDEGPLQVLRLASLLLVPGCGYPENETG